MAILDKTRSAIPGNPSRTSTARSIAWNYAGHFYQIAINLGLTAYVVRRIAVAEYGLLMLTMSLSATLYFLDLGLSSVLVQSYVAAALSNDKNRLSELISTAFVALTALGSIGVLLFVILAALLPGPFNIPHAYLGEASIVFILSSLTIQAGLPSIALELAYQAAHRFDRINQIKLVISTIQALFSVLVLAAGYRIIALALVQFIGATLQLLILALVLRNTIPLAHLRLAAFRWLRLQSLFHLSKWAVLNNLSEVVFDLLAWTILGSLGSMKEAALYGLAGKAPKQLWNLVDRGANVTLPILSKSWVEADHVSLRRTYLNTQRLIFGAVLPFILLGSIFARPLIQFWAGDNYVGAAPVLQWLLVAAFSHAFAYTSDLLLYACGETKRAATISLWAGAASVVSALLLVPRYGASGLAAGLSLSQLIVNCSWFTLAACRLSKLSPFTLLRTVSQGLLWPLLVTAIGVAIILRLWASMSTAWVLVAAVICGSVYLLLWGLNTALPLYRNQTEMIG